MSAHTPEPWEYSREHGEVTAGEGPEMVRIVDVQGWVGEAMAEQEANGDLIAAAPDLFVHGEHNLLAYKNLRTACGLTNDLEDIRAMEAALAKARGEARFVQLETGIPVSNDKARGEA